MRRGEGGEGGRGRGRIEVRHEGRRKTRKNSIPAMTLAFTSQS